MDCRLAGVILPAPHPDIDGGRIDLERPRLARRPSADVRAPAFPASSRLIGLNGETNSLKTKNSSAASPHPSNPPLRRHAEVIRLRAQTHAYLNSCIRGYGADGLAQFRPRFSARC